MENLLKPEITSALGWTLLHSLWQGLLLATLYFAVTKLVKSSELKYRFGIASMFIQFITAICSFLNLGDFSNNNELTAKGVLNFFLSQNVAPTKMNLTDTILFFLSTNLTVIVQVWLVFHYF